MDVRVGSCLASSTSRSHVLSFFSNTNVCIDSMSIYKVCNWSTNFCFFLQIRSKCLFEALNSMEASWSTWATSLWSLNVHDFERVCGSSSTCDATIIFDFVSSTMVDSSSTSNLHFGYKLFFFFMNFSLWTSILAFRLKNLLCWLMLVSSANATQLTA